MIKSILFLMCVVGCSSQTTETYRVYKPDCSVQGEYLIQYEKTFGDCDDLPDEKLTVAGYDPFDINQELNCYSPSLFDGCSLTILNTCTDKNGDSVFRNGWIDWDIEGLVGNGILHYDSSVCYAEYTITVTKD